MKCVRDMLMHEDTPLDYGNVVGVESVKRSVDGTFEICGPLSGLLLSHQSLRK